MSYKEKPQLKLYKYQNNAFVLQAIIDDYQECSFEINRFYAGQFSITINYNIPNASLFQRGLWVQFGSDHYMFGEILNITDSIGEDGKGSQLRIITGYDSRYIFKRRVIKNLNNNTNWAMTAKGELCMRNLIKDQCGSGAEAKRQLPVTNVIPSVSEAIGAEYSVAETFTNLYEVLVTIATQSEIGWRINFNGTTLTLEFYEGVDRHQTVRFDTDYESLSNGEFTDSSESFSNSVYVGGKGQGSDRDIYEGESAIEGQSPSGLDRFESWQDRSSMNTEAEYEAEALSILSQYGQTLEVSGQGLAKCPYEYGKEYNVGDIISIAFSGKSAVVQILSVTEHWAWGMYDLEFTFGKPINDLNKQLQLMLKQIQRAGSKTNSTTSVKWYKIPTATEMPSADVTFDTIGFTGVCAEGGSTFQLYLDDERTGAKNYNLYVKNLSGGNLTLTTGKTGATDLVLNVGTYVARIYVNPEGDITLLSSTPSNTVAEGDFNPVTSDAVAQALSESGSGIIVYKTLQDAEEDLPNLNVDDVIGTEEGGGGVSNSVENGDLRPVTSNAVSQSLSYSTTERKTGGVWIDGKPIYRKVWITTRNTYNDGNYYNIATYVSNFSLPNYESVTNCFITNKGQTTLFESCIIRYNSGALQIAVNKIHQTGSQLVIEYTKTTD